MDASIFSLRRLKPSGTLILTTQGSQLVASAAAYLHLLVPGSDLQCTNRAYQLLATNHHCSSATKQRRMADSNDTSGSRRCHICRKCHLSCERETKQRCCRSLLKLSHPNQVATNWACRFRTQIHLGISVHQPRHKQGSRTGTNTRHG